MKPSVQKTIQNLTQDSLSAATKRYKLLIYIVLWSCTSLSVANPTMQYDSISLNMQHVTLEQVINKIEGLSDYVFLFQKGSVDVAQRVSVDVKNMDLSHVLNRLFKDKGIRYVISDKQIILSRAKTAQQQVKRTVKGRVVDSQGEPLPGVTVVSKDNRTLGTVTDIDGKFVLTLDQSPSALIFSFIGMVTKEVVPEYDNTMRVELQEDRQGLEEVVVTAMSIERKAKSLTYATQMVGGAELTRAKDANFINSLQGKSAGLTITPNSSGAGGGSSKILLRGQSSMLGNNQPLIVLDGIPLSNGMSGQTQSLQYSGARDGGDVLSTINPDDIANISILKGANSAALYGSAANNGVIIITTKSGSKGKAKVSVSSNVTVESPLMLPQVQKDYGGTITNAYKMNFDGWGKKISEFTDEEIARLPYATKDTRDNIKDFFVLGTTYNNSVSINGGTEATQSYFSYGNTYQQGITPNNEFARHNLLFKQSYKVLNDKLKLDVSLNYIRQNTKNVPAIGKALNPLYGLYRTPANVDMRYFKNNYQHIAQADDDMVLGSPASTNKKLEGHNVQTWPWFSQHNNNPYWMINKVYNENIKERVLGSVTASADIVQDVVKAQGRLSVDNNSNRSKTEEYATLNRESRGLGGQYYTGRHNRTDVFADMLATVNKPLSDDVEFNATVGVSTKRINSRNFSVINAIDTAGMPNIFVPQNNKKNQYESSASTSETWSSDWEAAIFATAQLGFRGKGYVDVSFRNDWSKAFQQFAADDEYKSFPYYSVGGNLLLQELFPTIKARINYLKLRASYSEVGNSIPNSIYRAQSIDFHTGAITARPPEFDNPKPETTQSYEIGLEGAVMNNKLDFDVTVYNSVMENQFLYISTSSGQRKPINSGEVKNRGIEVSANYHLVNGGNWLWKSGFNFAFNDNIILSTYTPEGGEPQKIEMGDAAFKIKFIEGGSYGDLYVNSFQRDDQGAIMLDSQGAPLMSTGQYDTYVGNATANINMGWNNSISYKDISFYMLIDGKVGGKVMSLTEADLDRFGLSQRTADARNNGGTVVLPDGTGREVDAKTYYSKIGENPMESYVYDATNFRLREISLGYSFRDLFGNNNDLKVSFVARNVGFIYKDSPVDPDISMSAANGFGGIDVYALPTTRTLGLNIKLTF